MVTYSDRMGTLANFVVNINVASHGIFQDALSSPPAALAVRVPPQSPRILFNGTHILPGQNITVPAGSRATVVCEARYGNPPAYIEWYLGMYNFHGEFVLVVMSSLIVILLCYSQRM